MICKICKVQSRRSYINLTRLPSTDMAVDEFYDEAGCHHTHDPNVTGLSFECSNGHRGRIIFNPRCYAEDCTFGGGYDGHVQTVTYEVAETVEVG